MGSSVKGLMGGSQKSGFHKANDTGLAWLFGAMPGASQSDWDKLVKSRNEARDAHAAEVQAEQDQVAAQAKAEQDARDATARANADAQRAREAADAVRVNQAADLGGMDTGVRTSTGRGESSGVGSGSGDIGTTDTEDLKRKRGRGTALSTTLGVNA